MIWVTVFPDNGYEIEDDENFQLFKHKSDVENGKLDERKLAKSGTHVKLSFFLNILHNMCVYNNIRNSQIAVISRTNYKFWKRFAKGTN